MHRDITARILLVDDHPENLVALEAILEPLGQDLVRAASGTEALKRLLIDDFAVILLDVQMPGMDGFETATLIKERQKTRHIPILFVTAISKEEQYIFRGYSAGAVDYITKPIDPDILRSKVAVFVDLWQKNQQIREQAEQLRVSEKREAQREHLERERQMQARHLNALAEREAQLSQFKSTLDATHDGVFIFDQETLRTVYANQGALRQLGYEDAELNELAALDVFPDFEESHFRTLTAHSPSDAPGAQRFETMYRCKDDQRIPVEVSLQFISLGQGLGRFVAIVRDITERKRAEATLAAAFEKERRIANTLQNTLLLKPPEDAFPGVAIATFYEAAWEEANFGGDFFDAFSLGRDKVALVIGDVSGKGLAAAAHTAEIKYTLRAFLQESADPSRAMTRLNRVVCESQSRASGLVATFICLSLVVIDTAREQAAFVGAGTEAALILQPDGSAKSVETKGMPLGIDAAEKYPARRLSISLDDTILLVTDGITEARRGNDFFGYEGLVGRASREAPSKSLQQIGRAVLDAARDFTGGKLQDDACLLLARRR